MTILTWFGSHATWKTLEIITEHTVARWKPTKISAHWISRINAKFPSEVKIFCQNANEPTVHIEGPFHLSELQTKAAIKERQRVKSQNRPNDPHAIVVGKPHWQSDPPQIHAKTLDFAEVCALRSGGAKPEVLSSSAVIVCKEEKVLLFHKRARDVVTSRMHPHLRWGIYAARDTRCRSR